MKRTISISLAIVFALALTACRRSLSPNSVSMALHSSSSTASASGVSFQQQQITLTGPDGASIPLAVEIAQTPEQHEQGLMFRQHLDPDRGMLFVFASPRQLNFWMKNTLIPLDVLYFGANGNFLSSSTMMPCTTSECPTYGSVGEAQYALEVNAEFAEKHHVGSGWSFTQP